MGDASAVDIDLFEIRGLDGLPPDLSPVCLPICLLVCVL